MTTFKYTDFFSSAENIINSNKIDMEKVCKVCDLLHSANYDKETINKFLVTKEFYNFVHKYKDIILSTKFREYRDKTHYPT